MKRPAAILVCVMAVALACASTASASTSPRPVQPHYFQRNFVSVPAGPLAQARTQTYPVSGTLEDFDGTPLVNWLVSCGWLDPDGYSWYVPDARYHQVGFIRNADGSFSFAGLPSHPGHDSIEALGYSSSGSSFEALYLYHLDFSTTGSYVIRPGHVNISIADAPAGQAADIDIGNPLYSRSESVDVALTNGDGVADSLAPDFDSASAWFFNSDDAVTAECQWVSPGHVPVAVSPGTVAVTSLSFDWHSAVRGHLVGPQCRHSGRPGSTVRYTLSNLPSGERISFAGTSWTSWSSTTFPKVVTSTGLQKTYTVALHMPANAPVGPYEIDAQRTDDTQSLLWLYDYYEVCTFSASHNSIAHGQAVRLRGHIDGNKATLLVCRHWADQPATVKAYGWIKVANLHVNASGRFVSPLLHPSRTAWYVVRYRANGAWVAFVTFTPVVKVTVR